MLPPEHVLGIGFGCLIHIRQDIAGIESVSTT